MIGIIDYNAGNLNSIVTALHRLQADTKVVTTPDQLAGCAHVILPGVGAFPPAMKRLEKLGFSTALKELADSKKNVLGICLGMQLLFEIGYEDETCPGLGLVPGSVVRFSGNLKIPHMGWNEVKHSGHWLFSGLPESTHFYFANSYHALPENESYTIGQTEYGYNFASVIANRNVVGVQFHPEKSGPAGAKLLQNFIEH